ncbi:mechanosensitive ion channel [PVC group bacterium]|nr:mechanosensitive ion channel [PVC group bacterium]
MGTPKTSDELLFIVVVIFAAVILQLFLLILTKTFGRGGEGTLGDIRTAIGKALPLPLGIAIWIIAASLILQKVITTHELNDVVQIASGEDVVNFSALILMVRTALLIILSAWFLSRAVRAFSEVLNSWHENKDEVTLDSTAIQALASIGVVLAWFMGIVVMLQALGMNMNAVIALGGIGGAGIAFASKDVVANFFGGLLIMFNRPFQVGDSIKSGSKVEGKVTRIGLYATYLKTEDGNTLYVPNSIFNNSEILKTK